MKYIYHIEDNGNHIKCEHSNIDECMNELMQLFNKKSKTAWHYDGNINNEGEEEIK